MPLLCLIVGIAGGFLCGLFVGCRVGGSASSTPGAPSAFTFATKRRSTPSFPTHQEIGVSGTNEVCQTGSGRTLNISRDGVLLESDQRLRVGLDVHLSIAGPVILNKSVLSFSRTGG